MTLRDEIAKALAASNSWMLAHECRDSADALLPIVERVAVQSIREALEEFGFDWSARKERDALECVRRVMEGGQ